MELVYLLLAALLRIARYSNRDVLASRQAGPLGGTPPQRRATLPWWLDIRGSSRPPRLCFHRGMDLVQHCCSEPGNRSQDSATPSGRLREAIQAISEAS